MSYLESIRSLKISVISVTGICGYGYKENQVFDGNSIPHGGMCPFLQNNLVPYTQTFKNGGYFKWRKDSNSVEVLCPNPSGKVNTQLSREEVNSASILKYEVLSVGGDCPFGYKAGDSLLNDLQPGLCPLAYSILFPSIVACANGEKSSAKVRCPSTLGSVEFSIVKNR